MTGLELDMVGLVFFGLIILFLWAIGIVGFLIAFIYFLWKESKIHGLKRTTLIHALKRAWLLK